MFINGRNRRKNWEGLDPEKVRGLLDRVEKDEELKLLAEGKTDEAFNKRLERVNAQHQSELENVTGKLVDYESKLEKAEAQVRDLIIDQQVVTNFVNENGLKSGVPDVILRAKATFKIEDGQAIARDENGQIIRGKDGPITVQEWVAGLKDTAPHLFPQSSGAGASGSSGNGRDSVEKRLEEAAARGDMSEYRKIRKEVDAAGK